MSRDTRITVVVGDIVQQPDCEAIVNAANSALRAGSGVCGAIHAAAGPELEPFARALAPVPTGQAVITPGFELPNRWVIHAVGPRYHVDPDPARLLAAAMTEVLRVADANGVSRVGVPAISTGVYAYPLAEAAAVLVGAARTAREALVNVVEIRFVVVSQAAAAIFAATL